MIRNPWTSSTKRSRCTSANWKSKNPFPTPTSCAWRNSNANWKWRKTAPWKPKALWTPSAPANASSPPQNTADRKKKDPPWREKSSSRKPSTTSTSATTLPEAPPPIPVTSAQDPLRPVPWRPRLPRPWPLRVPWGLDLLPCLPRLIAGLDLWPLDTVGLEAWPGRLWPGRRPLAGLDPHSDTKQTALQNKKTSTYIHNIETEKTSLYIRLIASLWAGKVMGL